MKKALISIEQPRLAKFAADGEVTDLT